MVFYDEVARSRSTLGETQSHPYNSLYHEEKTSKTDRRTGWEGKGGKGEGEGREKGI